MAARRLPRIRSPWLALAALALGCMPRSDLQTYGRGDPSMDARSGAEADGAGSASDEGAPESADDDDGSGTDGARGAGGDAGANVEGGRPSSAAPDPGTNARDAGAFSDAGQGDPAHPADASVAEPEPPRALGPLPDDLIDAPVAGEITFAHDAAWEVDSLFEPTFEIHTPSASYWVVKPLGTIVSLEDRAGNNPPSHTQWIAFSSGFRPLRGVPAFPEQPDQRMTTTLDEDSQTPTHLRLDVQSPDGAWRWTWDFYVTHVTLTLERAPVALGFGYRGVPASNLGEEDKLVQADGTTQGARSSFSGDLPGPFEWIYLADTSVKRSLYLIQHYDDDLPEKYQVRDNDSAHFLFGSGQITDLPMRFSLGLIDTSDHAALTERVAYVDRVMR